MASKTVIIDDLNGEEGAQTVRFSIDDETWSIDLTEANRERLRQSLQEFIENADSVSRRRGSRASRTTGKASEIREWARRRGFEVSDRGRIPAHVMDEYAVSLRQM